MKTKLKITLLCVTILSATCFSQKLVYSTYLGSSGKDGDNCLLKNFSLNSDGTVYFASSTYHSDFPVTNNAYSKTYKGGIDWGKEDLAIVQFNIKQNNLKYASYFGGKTGPDFISQGLLNENSFYIVGNTGSSDLPITNNAYDKTFNGPKFRHADGYIARFDSNKLTYLTYLGTGGNDRINKIFITDKGEIIVLAMFSEWNELPVSHVFSDEKLKDNGNACILRLNAKGDSVLSMTVLGPTWDFDAVRDNEGNLYIAGTTPSKNFPVTSGAYGTKYNGGDQNFRGDIFVTKLTPSGDQILFSTFLGGSNNEGSPSLCLDASNNIIVYGLTYSKDFPMTPDALDKSFDGNRELFLTKLSADGKQLLYSSFMGGNEKENSGEYAENIIAAQNGDIYICGTTGSDNFPITFNAIQSKLKGSKDIFISVFDNSLTKLKFSTYFGGSADDDATIAVDSVGNVIGVGSTKSSDFLTTPGAYSTALNGEQDIIIFKISPEGEAEK